MKSPSSKCLHLNKLLLQAAGLWPRDDAQSLLSRYLRTIPPTCLATTFYACVVATSFSLYHHSHDVSIICETLASFFITSMIAVRVACLYFNAEDFRELVADVEALWTLCQEDDETRDMVEAIDRKVTKLTRFFLGLCTTWVMLLFSWIPRLFSNRELFVSDSTPWKNVDYPYFELQLVGWSYAIGLWIISVCAVNMFITALLLHIGGQFRILRHKIGKILPVTDQVVVSLEDRTMQSVGTINNQVEEEEDDITLLRENEIRTVDDNSKELENEILFESISPDNVLKSLSTSTNVEIVTTLETVVAANDAGIDSRLADCIQQHQAILRLSSKFSSTFSVIFLNQLLCNLFAFGVTIIYSSSVETFNEKTLSNYRFASALIAVMFLYCRLADAVTEESEAMREAVYGCDWFEASESFKRSMRIMMSMANQPVVIKAAGFIPISVETFYNVTRLTYSYYTAMKSSLKT